MPNEYYVRDSKIATDQNCSKCKKKNLFFIQIFLYPFEKNDNGQN